MIRKSDARKINCIGLIIIISFHTSSCYMIIGLDLLISRDSILCITRTWSYIHIFYTWPYSECFFLNISIYSSECFIVDMLYVLFRLKPNNKRTIQSPIFEYYSVPVPGFIGSRSGHLSSCPALASNIFVLVPFPYVIVISYHSFSNQQIAL